MDILNNNFLNLIDEYNKLTLNYYYNTYFLDNNEKKNKVQKFSNNIISSLIETNINENVRIDNYLNKNNVIFLFDAFKEYLNTNKPKLIGEKFYLNNKNNNNSNLNNTFTDVHKINNLFSCLYSELKKNLKFKDISNENMLINIFINNYLFNMIINQIINNISCTKDFSSKVLTLNEYYIFDFQLLVEIIHTSLNSDNSKYALDNLFIEKLIECLNSIINITKLNRINIDSDISIMNLSKVFDKIVESPSFNSPNKSKSNFITFYISIFNFDIKNVYNKNNFQDNYNNFIYYDKNILSFKYNKMNFFIKLHNELQKNLSCISFISIQDIIKLFCNIEVSLLIKENEAESSSNKLVKHMNVINLSEKNKNSFKKTLSNQNYKKYDSSSKSSRSIDFLKDNNSKLQLNEEISPDIIFKHYNSNTKRARRRSITKKDNLIDIENSNELSNKNFYFRSPSRKLNFDTSDSNNVNSNTSSNAINYGNNSYDLLNKKRNELETATSKHTKLITDCSINNTLNLRKKKNYKLQ